MAEQGVKGGGLDIHPNEGLPIEIYEGSSRTRWGTDVFTDTGIYGRRNGDRRSIGHPATLGRYRRYGFCDRCDREKWGLVKRSQRQQRTSLARMRRVLARRLARFETISHIGHIG